MCSREKPTVVGRGDGPAQHILERCSETTACEDCTGFIQQFVNQGTAIQQTAGISVARDKTEALVGRRRRKRGVPSYVDCPRRGGLPLGQVEVPHVGCLTSANREIPGGLVQGRSPGRG